MRHRQVLSLDGVAHNAPIPLAVRVGQMIFTSGISGKDPQTGTIPPDPDEQVRLMFEHLVAVLRQANAGPGDLGQVAITVVDEALRADVDRHWLRLFPEPDDRPARHVSVGPLRGGAAVQLQAIAVAADTALQH